MIELGNHMHGHQIAKATHAVYNPHGETVISRSENGVLYGGVVYDSYSGVSICMHVASFRPNWMNRNLLWLVFTYPFKQLRCKVIIGRVGSNNLPALKFDTHIGFKIVATIPDAVPDGDLHILTMHKEDCKWLNLKPRKLLFWDHLKARREAA